MADQRRAGEDGFCPHGMTVGLGCTACASRQDEYRTCQRRGHEPSGHGVTVGWESWSECKWCQTMYRVETTHIVHEGDKPYGVDDDD